MSDILMENNRLGLGRKRTHQINMRYFFITDQVWSKDLSIKYCPNHDMIAVFYKSHSGIQVQEIPKYCSQCLGFIPPLYWY